MQQDKHFSMSSGPEFVCPSAPVAPDVFLFIPPALSACDKGHGSSQSAVRGSIATQML